MNGFVGLLKIELPDRDVRLSEGGFITFNSELYTSSDPVLGSIAAVEPMQEGIGGTIPALDLTFAPPGPAAITDLSVGALQRSNIYLWLAEYNVETNAIVGTPDALFIGQLDQPSVRFGRGEYSISISCVSKLEVLFNRNTGNSLSSTFHKSMFAGELGHDNAIGLSVAVAWGVKGPPSLGGSNFGGGVGTDQVAR